MVGSFFSEEYCISVNTRETFLYFADIRGCQLDCTVRESHCVLLIGVSTNVRSDTSNKYATLMCSVPILFLVLDCCLSCWEERYI
jgi:hypothetical protein